MDRRFILLAGATSLCLQASLAAARRDVRCARSSCLGRICGISR